MVAPTRPTTRRASTVVEAPTSVHVGALRFLVPGEWSLQCLTGDGPTKARAVAPADAVGGGVAVLSVDEPDLPFHIPGLIPIGAVADGYVDDERKAMPDAAGPPPSAMTVPGAKARRVTLRGHDAAGRATVDEAVLLVHGDHVYVVSVDADPTASPAATAVLNAAVASISWGR